MINSPVYVKQDSSALHIDLQEVLRYMGAVHTEDASVIRLAEKAVKLLKEHLHCRAGFMLTELQSSGDEMDFGFCTVQSAGLARHLCDSRYLLVFAASVGMEADRLIMRTQLSEPSLGLALQAAGGAAIEAYCDMLCATEFQAMADAYDLHLTSRFSPGYGDLDLKVQKDILGVLKCPEKLGLTMTDGYMLTPSKSVTAFLGLKPTEECRKDKCSLCKKADCIYRTKR